MARFKPPRGTCYFVLGTTLETQTQWAWVEAIVVCGAALTGLSLCLYGLAYAPDMRQRSILEGLDCSVGRTERAGSRATLPLRYVGSLPAL